ncbi:hypothetical protein [Methanolobus tindarius]|uniref:hypothetical protein n=1 Tax=Methanolobus tindarius TaxID=2221 RepID=UPI0012EBD2DE|nr:hypothetical protein [Methanolobus tindarius]
MKDVNSESTKIRRKFLESLSKEDKLDEGMVRSELRAEHKIKPEEGKTHVMFKEMGDNGLIIEKNETDGQIRAIITEQGIGYLKCMKDFGIGK